MSERAQASVEVAAAAPLVLLTVLALAQVVVALRAADRAERIAGTAAALRAQGRPAPDSLRAEAALAVSDGRIRATVAIPRLLPLLPPLDATGEARLW